MSRRPSLKTGVVLIGVVLLSVLAAFSLMRGYDQSWTGFGAYVGADGKTVPPKRLWDWLSLLIVPFFLACAVWALNDSRKRSEARTENDRQRQKSLDDYFEWTSSLILAGHLDDLEKGEQARRLARTRTLTVLQTLDADRKAQVLQFLYEAEMLRAPPTITLVGADFSYGSFDEATLANAEVRGAYFNGATFRGANLRDADLRGCDFTGVDFSSADLTGANLRQTTLHKAITKTATLTNVDLEGADFLNARRSRKKQPREDAL